MKPNLIKVQSWKGPFRSLKQTFCLVQKSKTSHIDVFHSLLNTFILLIYSQRLFTSREGKPTINLANWFYFKLLFLSKFFFLTSIGIWLPIIKIHYYLSCTLEQQRTNKFFVAPNLFWTRHHFWSSNHIFALLWTCSNFS